MVYAMAAIGAAVQTGLVIGIALLLLRAFASTRSAPFGALCVGIGFLLGRYSFQGPPTVEAALALCRFAGSASVVVAVWTWYRRRTLPAAD